MQVQAGARIAFKPEFQKTLKEQWESEKLEPSLRMMILVTAMMFHEQGANRLQISKLLGNTPEELNDKTTPHIYGCAADFSVNNIMDGRMSVEVKKTYRNPRALFIVDRLNNLFPLGTSKMSACYNLNHIHVEVPIGGFNKQLFTLSSWLEDGCDGYIKDYRRRAS